jgi:hypothetical protein
MIQLDACRCDDGFVLVAGTHDLLEQHVWVTWVTGLWQHAEETQDPSFAPGEPLVLDPEPDNPVDEEAIGIWNGDHSLMGGYLGRWEAASMTPGQRVGLALLEHVEDGSRTGLLIAVSEEPIHLVGASLDPVQLARHLDRLPSMPTRHSPAIDPVEAMWKMVGGAELITPDDISRRIIAAISEDGARVLLDLLTRPEAERAALIGRVGQHADGEWLAELLMDFEVDEGARLHLISTLQRELELD